MAAPARTQERLRHHFEVERELATRLRASNREERTELFKTLYDELFERVEDHPRLTRRVTEEDSRRKVEGQLKILRPFLSPDAVLVEVACGDGRLAVAASKETKEVIGLDISDQRHEGDSTPDNFRHVVYDGYDLDLPDQIADVAFSYQFLEHLHPDDVGPHFDLIARLLKPGGWYVFDTPHRYSGPHDISAAFGDELVCFHFQEWSFNEMRQLAKAHGFGSIRIYRGGKLVKNSAMIALHLGIETVVGLLPGKLRKKISQRVFSSVTMAAQKTN